MGYYGMTDNFISTNLKNKSFDENTEQIYINSIEWKNYDDTYCPQCGHSHGYELTIDPIQEMISFLDRYSLKKYERF
jgi:acetone carboxylase gamma subunit